MRKEDIRDIVLKFFKYTSEYQVAYKLWSSGVTSEQLNEVEDIPMTIKSKVIIELEKLEARWK